MKKPILQISSISKAFDDVVALDNVSESIQPGEFFYLLGPSGCGKTTLLRIISGLTEPDSGQILLDGKDVSAIPIHKRDIHTVFQQYALFPHLSVFENIAFGLKMKKVSADQIKSRVADMLRLIELTGFEDRKPNTLSGGQQQRVALARALVNQPAVVLLDEPLGALDVKLRKAMQRELRQIQRKLGATFICVTHDQEEAMSMADRIAVMNEGKILQTGTPEAIYNEPSNEFVAGFMGDINLLGAESFDANDAFYSVKTRSGDNVKAVRQSSSPENFSGIGIRPEKMKIGAKSPEKTNCNILSGKVTESVFSGSFRTCTVKTTAGDELRVIVRDTDHHVPEKGSECFVWWKFEDTMLLNS